MKKLYANGNYVIAEDPRGTHEYGKAKSVYSVVRNPDGYIIKEMIDTGELVIPTAEIGTWYDETGLIPYTEATLVAFLRENTANFSSGGVSTFEALTDTPSYVGNALKGLRINAAEDAVEPYVATDLNQWLMKSVAFVNPVTGDDDSAVVGDGNLPYATVTSAMLVADWILLLPADYTETVNVTLDNKEIHAMAGVDFRLGGFRITGAGVTRFRFSGDAVFTGTSEALRVYSVNAVVDFECDYIDNRLVLWIESGLGNSEATVRFKCNWIRCSAFNGAGYCVRLIGNADIKMDVAHYFQGQHTPLHVRSNTTGRLVVNCPKIEVIPNYTSNYGNAAKKVIWCDSVNGAYIEVNGNLFSDTGAAYGGAGVSNCISIENWTNANATTLIVNGDIQSVDAIPIFANYRAAYGNIIIKGNIISDRNAMYDALTGWGAVADQRWTFNGSIVDATFHWLVGRGKTYDFKDCSFLVNEDGSVNPSAGYLFTGLEPGSPASQSYLNFFNCVMQSKDTTLDTFNMSANFNLATINTHSNLPIGVGVVDSWSGFTSIPSLTVPKLK